MGISHDYNVIYLIFLLKMNICKNVFIFLHNKGWLIHILIVYSCGKKSNNTEACLFWSMGNKNPPNI